MFTNNVTERLFGTLERSEFAGAKNKAVSTEIGTLLKNILPREYLSTNREY